MKKLFIAFQFIFCPQFFSFHKKIANLMKKMQVKLVTMIHTKLVIKIVDLGNILKECEAKK